MKLVLHIGTHKTGTTALQQFSHANRKLLAARGFHYATPPHGLQHSNLVANALTAGESRSVQTFSQTTRRSPAGMVLTHFLPQRRISTQ